jgi:hypothetical protein
MFIDEATAKLTALGTAIDAIPSRIPPAPDPATIVPVADQQAVLSGIDAATAKANDILA